MMKFDRLKNIIIEPRRRNRIVTGLVISVLLVMLLFSDYGIIKRVSLNMKAAEYRRQIEYHQKVNDSLEARIEQLKNDTLLIEKIAREKYGMIKPGETVILIED